jgi:hypothetical protein
MVLRANDPNLSAISSYPGPKILRKCFVRNLPRFFAADAVIVFTGAPPTYRAVWNRILSDCTLRDFVNCRNHAISTPNRSDLLQRLASRIYSFDDRN